MNLITTQNSVTSAPIAAPASISPAGAPAPGLDKNTSKEVRQAVTPVFPGGTVTTAPARTSAQAIDQTINQANLQNPQTPSQSGNAAMLAKA